MRYRYLKAVPVILLGIGLATGCSEKKKAPAPAEAKPVAAAPAEAPKPKEPAVELKVTLEAGKRYLLREESISETPLKLPNQPEPVKSTTTTARELALTILSQKPEGGQEIEVEFVANKVESKMGDRVVAAFNSADDPKTDRTNALAKLNRKIVGGKFNYTTDAAGHVDKVEGVSNLVRKITLGLDKNSSTMLKAQFNEESMKKMGLIAEGLPKQAVAPGDAWTNTFEMPIMGGMVAKFTIQSSLKGYEERDKKRCAIIKNTGTAQVSAGTTPQAAAVQFENVKLDGETVLDPEKSMLVSANNSISLDMKVNAGAQPNVVSMNIKSVRTLVSVTDAKPAEAKPATKP